jgi:hypothetical protein
LLHLGSPCFAAFLGQIAHREVDQRDSAPLNLSTVGLQEAFMAIKSEFVPLGKNMYFPRILIKNRLQALFVWIIEISSWPAYQEDNLEEV